MLSYEEHKIIDDERDVLLYILEYGDDNEVTMTLQHTQLILKEMRFSFEYFGKWVAPYGVSLATLMEAVSFDHSNRDNAIKELREKMVNKKLK